jgi:hypothetical protein
MNMDAGRPVELYELRHQKRAKSTRNITQQFLARPEAAVDL